MCFWLYMKEHVLVVPQDAALKRTKKHNELQAKSTRLKAKLSSLLVLLFSCSALAIGSCVRTFASGYTLQP